MYNLERREVEHVKEVLDVATGRDDGVLHEGLIGQFVLPLEVDEILRLVVGLGAREQFHHGIQETLVHLDCHFLDQELAVSLGEEI